jgi:hypothetical protein
MAQQREWDIKACHSAVFGVNGTPEVTHILPKILSYFFLSQSLSISEGILAHFSLSSLVAPNYLGGTARRRGRPRDGAPDAKVEPTAWS